MITQQTTVQVTGLGTRVGILLHESMARVGSHRAEKSGRKGSKIMSKLPHDVSVIHQRHRRVERAILATVVLGLEVVLVALVGVPEAPMSTLFLNTIS